MIVRRVPPVRLDYPKFKLDCTTNEDGTRFYVTPTGRVYPSMTTVLGSLPNPGLDQWKRRIGATAAKRVGTAAANRGTKIHKIFEEYLRDGTADFSSQMPDIRQMVSSTIPLLNLINSISVQESTLWCDQYRLAGTPDLIGEWEGVLSVIDFKTSGRLKSKDYIENYFAQCTGYSIMFEERFGIKIDQIVVVIAVENNSPQVFIERADDHLHYLKRAVKTYWKNNANNKKKETSVSQECASEKCLAQTAEQ